VRFKQKFAWFLLLLEFLALGAQAKFLFEAWKIFIQEPLFVVFDLYLPDQNNRLSAVRPLISCQIIATFQSFFSP
jgi:hypothetical protein